MNSGQFGSLSGSRRYIVRSAIALTLIFVTGLASGQNYSHWKWSANGSLSAPRTWPTATLLPNGLVLIAGGYGGREESARAELYVPKEGIFKQVAEMGMARANQTATLLQNGKVLVAGGQMHGAPLASAELFDPTSNTWTSTGNLQQARCYHTATLLSDGRVLVIGGTSACGAPEYPQGTPCNGPLYTAEIYDPATGTWSTTGSLHQARLNHTTTLLRNGDVLVTGGMGTPMADAASASPDPAVAIHRRREGLDSMYYGFGYLKTESSTELYNPKTGKWTMIASMAQPRFVHSATLLPNGKVLIAGGKPDPQSDSGACELYDPVTKSWSETGTLPQPVNAHTATLLPNGDVLVVGGANANGVLTNVETYHPATGNWTVMTSLNIARSLHTATVLPDGRILVAGGDYSLGDPSFVMASAELFSPAKATAHQQATPTVDPEPDSSPQPVLPGVD